MKRRLKSLFLVCIICTMLVGCGSSNISVESSSSRVIINVDNIKETLHTENIIPLNDSFSIFYYSFNYQVVILDYHTGGENEISNSEHIDVIDLKVDGKPVYYDAENDCFTTEPLNN